VAEAVAAAAAAAEVAVVEAVAEAAEAALRRTPSWPEASVGHLRPSAE
jgi:hypothetical protein